MLRPQLEQLEDRNLCANLDGLLLPGVTPTGSYGKEAVKAVLKVLDQVTRPVSVKASALPSAPKVQTAPSSGSSNTRVVYQSLPPLNGTKLKDTVFSFDLLTPLDGIKDNNGKRLVLRSFK